MGKIKKIFQPKSIKTAFAEYMLACIFSALLMALIFSGFCQYGQSLIYKKYEKQLENSSYKTKIEFYEEADDNNLGTLNSLNYYTVDILSFSTPLENLIYDILGIFSVAFYPICFIISLIIVSILFYKKEIQIPLEMLDYAADNIRDNNLNFKIV